MNKKIGFIGGGNMGGAIIGGMVSSGLVSPGDIILYDKDPKTTEALSAKFGIKTGYKITDAAKCDIVFLAVKPNVIFSVIDEIKGKTGDNTIIVSIAAGKSIKCLTNRFECDIIKVVRVMPNTPALVGEGMAAVSLCDELKKPGYKADVDLILSIFESFGRAMIVPEELMDVVTGVSGSSPAYVFMFIEAMADAAVAGGMKRADAYVFAAQAVLGSAKMVLELGLHPGALKDMVCSPGGTTIEAVRILEEKGFRGAVMDAVGECIKKSKNM